MTFKPTTHSAFTLKRNLDAPPALVFQAFSTKEGKQRWFVAHAAKEKIRAMDFRVGGEEKLAGEWPNGMVSEFTARYFDIKPDERIIYTYEMRLNGVKISTSLATVEFQPRGKGTTLVLTEQHAFVDGYEDNGSREEGTNGLLDQLVASFNPKH
ncbi:MAG: SRPBCC family protein [Proteobacteria bacterium]|nr:SRPBCC family protein [Pseudomonadota bacterium]